MIGERVLQSSDLHRLEQAFTSVMQHPPERRRAEALLQFADEPDLQSALVQLVETEANSGDLLAEPSSHLELANLLALQGMAAAHEPDSVGTVIGPYTLIEMIGEGGFAYVFSALQTSPIHRTVAIKIGKAGTHPAQPHALFDKERQSLAKLDHPNIARILDAGTTPGGKPFFVMDLVRGERITKFCDVHRMTIRERVELFCQVCDAIAHAAENGVVHRDIKPANVLVTMQNNKPLAKVIDFGIAKFSWGVPSVAGARTDLAGVLGTPAYMSPEQAQGDVTVDSRSDVYSLGCVLRELVVGSPPFSQAFLAGMSSLDAARCVASKTPDTPLKALGDKLSMQNEDRHFITHRRTSPRSITRDIRSDLNDVMLKALQPEPSRRYQSARDLADDLRRYLAMNPVLARPHSRVYLATSFAKRNRKLVAIALLAFLFLLAGVIATSIAGYTAVRRARQLEIETAKAHAAAEAAAAREAESIHALYAANIHAAAASSAIGELAGMRSALQACPEHQRGWEWRYLQGMTDDSQRVLDGFNARVIDMDFAPHESLVAACAGNGRACIWRLDRDSPPTWLPGSMVEVRRIRFSPDGQSVVTSDEGGFVRVFDVATGALRTARRVHIGRVGSVEYSPDGRNIVTAAADTTAVILDASSLETKFVLQSHSGGVQIAGYSPDGSCIATISDDGTACLWDPLHGDLRFRLDRRIDGQTLWLMSMAFSPDSSRLAAGSGAGDVFVWRTSDGSLVAEHRERGRDVLGIEFDHTGRRLISTDSRGSSLIWDVESAPEPDSLPYTDGGSRACAWNQDSTLIAIAGQDRIVRIFSAAEGRLLRTLRGHTALIDRVAFHPTLPLLVTVAADQTVRTWDLKASPQQLVLSGHEDQVRTTVYSPDGSTLLTSSLDNTARLWDSASGQEVLRFVGHQWHLLDAQFSSDARRVVTASSDGTARIWDAHTGDCIRPLSQHTGAVRTARFNRDDSCVLTSSYDETAIKWNATTGEKLVSFEGHHDRVLHAQYSPDCGSVLTHSRDGTLKLWDEQTGALRQTFRGHAGLIRFAQFSASGSLIVSASEDQSAKVWNVKTGETITTLAGHTGQVRCARFNADTSLIATGSADHTARVWDAKSGSEVLILRGHDRPVDFVAFHPTEHRLATGAADGTVRLWDTRTGRELLIVGSSLRAVYSLDFSPDGESLLASCGDWTGRVWRVRKAVR